MGRKKKVVEDQIVDQVEKEVIASETEIRTVDGHKVYLTKQHLGALKQAIDSGLPVLLVGETGVGKTTVIREIARERNVELIRLNLTGQTGVDEFLGKYLVRGDGHGGTETYWVDGPVVHAMKQGMWVVLDEVNMANAEILSALHSLLDDDRSITLKEKNFEKIVPHEGFRIFGTMNPEDEYAGTKELNKAFLSRFPVIMNIEYSEFEHDIILEQGGIEKKDADLLMNIANELRSSKANNNISYTCSTRDLIQCAKLIAGGMAFEFAMEIALLNKAPKNERAGILKLLEICLGKEIKFSSGKTFKSIKHFFKEYEEADKKFTDIKNDLEQMKQKANNLETQRDQVIAERDNLRADLEKEKIDHDNTRTKAQSVLDLIEKIQQK